MGIDRDAIFTPVRGVNVVIGAIHPEGQRETRWTVRLDDQLLWVPSQRQTDLWQFSLTGHVTDSQFFASIDERLKNQRDSIDRMLKHLKQHCPQLLGQGSCEHMPV